MPRRAERAREAVRDRLVHRGLLPPRPRPDEGHHRRGHARRQLLRADARRGDPPRVRADRRDRHRRPGAGHFKPEIDASFAALAFYGAIEQMLTGWIFELLPRGEEHYERSKWLVVETVCGGLERAGAGATTSGNTLPG